MKFSTIISATLVLALSAGANAQVRYTVHELAGPVGPANPYAINASGDVAGFAPDANAAFHAARWGSNAGIAPAAPGFTQTISTCIDSSGRSASQAYSMGGLGVGSLDWSVASFIPLGDFAARALNDSGVIVGSAPLASSGMYFPQACVLANGSLQILPTLGGNSAQAMGVSASGVIVGSSFTTTAIVPRPCAWIGGTCIDLGTLGGASGQALAINDTGGVVGTAAIASGVLHPFRYVINSAGQVTQRIDLGVIAAGTTGTAMGVNSAGEVVGVSNWNACLWSGGTIHDLNTMIPANSDWRLDVASAINDHGEIVGWGFHVGQPRGFMLTPHCVADVDDGSGTGTPDGGVSIDDLLYYLIAFENGLVSADIDNGSGTGTSDGGVDINDLLYFLLRFEAGC